MSNPCRTSSLHVGAVLLLLGLVGDSLADPQAGPSDPAVREALQSLNTVVGGWRGVGQPRRGSNAGAWSEKAEFSWDFSGKQAAIKYVVDKGKLATEGAVTYDPAHKQYQMTLKAPDGSTETLTGSWDKNQLVLTSGGPAAQQRVTVTLLNEKRTLVLFEERGSAEGNFNRVAEVGYTRAGTRLALPGGGQPECVVTGGAASIPVSYKGKTYYVCCTGCKQAFDDDPEGILAEYAARVKQAREKAASGS